MNDTTYARISSPKPSPLFGALALLALTAALFSPVAAQVTPPPQMPLNLRSSATFDELAASLISNIPTSAVTGDIGLSPATGSNITGFGPNEVTGTVYTVDASGPAGSVADATRLTAAKGDLTTAYNDAVARTPVPSGAYLNPDNGSGNIGGMTLVPGLYKFTSSVSITGSNLTLAGGPNAVWIFQIASDLTIANGIHVILSGGARAANIFWQVGTSANLGTTSVFKGTILADQSISMNTGASLEGRAMARIAAVTLSSNTITHPGAATTNLLGAASRQYGVSQDASGRGLEFTVANAGMVSLKLFDTRGREIATLFNGVAQAGTRNRATLPIANLSRGLYFTQLASNGSVRQDRLLLGN
jgi:hypothetical protein